MLHFFKFRQELFSPQPAKDIYVKRPAGRGWPEECPPLRAANGFGWDVLANFDVTFIRGRRNQWRVEPDVVIDSDFDYAAEPDAPGRPLRQQYAWFWEKRQKLPHRISDNVHAQISNQVKISSFLFLKTDPNELLLMTEIPNLRRAFRAMSAVIDTDWYPASYPWHAVIELDQAQQGRTDLPHHPRPPGYLLRRTDVSGGVRRLFRPRAALVGDARQVRARTRRRGCGRSHADLRSAAGAEQVRGHGLK
jgi:hypothetical protein